jgi:hypothetical protein
MISSAVIGSGSQKVRTENSTEEDDAQFLLSNNRQKYGSKAWNPNREYDL